MIKKAKLMMKAVKFSGLICIGLLTYCSQPGEQIASETTLNASTVMESKQLRHVVLFKFKQDADPAAIAKVEAAFAALKEKIPEIQDFEWGLNNSPEGLDKGFTHCYFLTFNSEEDRAVYLPHPDHKAFGGLLTDILDDVLVVDYWVK